ncbi:MAG: valine--tRNA ligase [Myxococcales bacterium]|nr:valine--tRNA ligase [Myxococcales bacterium]
MSEKSEAKTITACPPPCESPTFDPAAIEEGWYKWWDENGFFQASVNKERKPYTIMIPLPNVTGALHLGHALNNTIQDFLIRHARMEGHETLWMPGTDHAGVATQAVVERRLWEEEGLTRHDLGRRQMLERIWVWKEHYGGRILSQLRRLGASLDWSRTQFTMSPEFTHAVQYAFSALFRDGLVYRGKRLINWSVGIQSALSNDELVYKNVKTHFWFFRYPVVGEEGSFIEIATTRPETMLGDTAVAVHPDPETELRKRLEAAEAAGQTEKAERLRQRIEEDLPRLQRYAAMVGKELMLPIVNRPIPIIGDAQLADPEKGTGAVKVTPAHDPNDYACGQRNGLPMINIMTPDGRLNEETPEAFQGLTMAEGRAKVVAEMKDLGFLVKIEDLEHEVAHCYRTSTVIEPYLLSQWFVKMQPLVDMARKTYEDEEVFFHPEHRGKDYMRWLDSTPDWCISRQVWWGHRIPIWYCKDCYPSIQLDQEGDPIGFTIPEDATPIVPDTDERGATPAACPKCGGTHLVQDPDVLDTWFSSQLFPMATLGWPEKTEDLAYFYPTSTLVTGRDILALWVARMIMMGMNFLGETPFRHVVLHGTIQDEHGDIMSKSRGNGFDPVRAIEGGGDEIKGKEALGDVPAHRKEYYKSYGADSLRYGMLSMTAGQSQDIKMQILRERRDKEEEGLVVYDVEIPRFEEGRRFGNKIWQASRGVVFRQCEGFTVDARIEAVEDRWLYHRLHEAIVRIQGHVERFQLGQVCEEIYQLFWDDFCSWYLEIVKPRLWGQMGEESKAQAQTHLVRALDITLRLLHPVMPFLTEELWQGLRKIRVAAGETELPVALISAPWPELAECPKDEEAAQLTAMLREIAGQVNQMRAQQPGVTDQTVLPLMVLYSGDAAVRAKLTKASAGLSRFLRIDAIEDRESFEPPALSVRGIVGDVQLCCPLEGVIDIQAEIDRLQKQLEQHVGAIERINKQLGNAKFVERAPADVVAQTRERLGLEEQKRDTLQAQLKELAGLV